jgi:hypothetical protein
VTTLSERGWLEAVWAFVAGISRAERPIFWSLMATAVALGFLVGRRRREHETPSRFKPFGVLRFPRFQNSGEARVTAVLRDHFGAPDYHLMNHVTVRMADGTTQVDHILVSRFGVFVIETKDYSGWIFGGAKDPKWTQVHYQWKSRFQNPIQQNYRHLCAVQDLLDFLPSTAVRSVVVFTGDAEFKTERPDGVVDLRELPALVSSYTEPVMTLNRLQFCVGRLETARLALSRETDVEHIESLARRLGTRVR